MESGFYVISHDIGYYTPMILKGAKAGIDARNRSNIGNGNSSFVGCDLSETTLFSTLNMMFIL